MLFQIGNSEWVSLDILEKSVLKFSKDHVHSVTFLTLTDAGYHLFLAEGSEKLPLVICCCSPSPQASCNSNTLDGIMQQ